MQPPFAIVKMGYRSYLQMALAEIKLLFIVTLFDTSCKVDTRLLSKLMWDISCVLDLVS